MPIGKWEEYQRTPPNEETLRRWFGNGHRRNIGIVTGAVSKIVVVDTDSAEAVAWADKNLPATPMAVKTSRGLHRYYKHPGSEYQIRNRARVNTGDPLVLIDVRGDGGYVVGPGSRHVSGADYQRVGPWPLVSELPVFDPNWLVPDLPADSEKRNGNSTLTISREDRLRRARLYAGSVPPAIEGQGGDAHTFNLCCKLVRGFALSESDTFDVLSEWNTKCLPPWSDAELQAKIQNALKYGEEPVGARAFARTATRSGASIDTAGVLAVSTRDDFPRTDAGNAEHFAALYGDRVKFDHRRNRFLYWTGNRWAPDADGEIWRLALESVRKRLNHALLVVDSEARKAGVKHAFSSESRGKLESILSIARSLRSIADDGSKWDANPRLLGTPNGVVDLYSGKLRAGRPDDYITMTTKVRCDLEGRCERWLKFLNEIFASDQKLIDFVHRAIGYSLSGDTSAQCIFLGYGTGSNGKTTLINTIRELLGDYAWNMPFSTIELNQRASIPNDLAALVNRRFVIASETNDGTRLNEARIKSLSGCDPITARFLHGEFFTFEPVGKFWLAANHKPVVRDDSFGFWRRLRLIPFTQTFQVDPTLAHTLRSEGPAILGWAVRGCLAWQSQGLQPPDSVLAATAEYQADSDPLRTFLDAACIFDNDASERASVLFEHYKRWADREGMSDRERLSSTAFGRKVSERFQKVRDGAGSYYKGVSITGV